MSHRGRPWARVLVVGCGFPQLGLIRFCRQQQLEVVGLDANPSAVGRSECDRWVLASTADAEAIAQAVRDQAVDGVATAGSDLAVLPTALAAEATGRDFYVSSDLLRGVLHKHDMRARFQAGGAPSPPFRLIHSLPEAEDFAGAHGLPLVVKPSRGWGQRGVRVVMHASELAAGVQAALAAAAGTMVHPGCLVEQYIAGREFSVDAYTQQGRTEILAVTERLITEYPDPPGITYAEVHPAQLSCESQAAVEQAAIHGLEALGYRRGPSYTQLRSGLGGAFILETALRLGGGLDPEVTFLASGISLYRRIVGVALARTDWEAMGPEAPARNGAVGRFLVARPGRVQRVEGLELARQMPGIVDAQVYVRPGGTVHPLVDGSKRAGHVLAHGQNRDDAEEKAQQAMRVMHIVTESP
ncbi:ATP-grasp domain-containing protein [Myxococcota bacterium]